MCPRLCPRLAAGVALAALLALLLGPAETVSAVTPPLVLKDFGAATIPLNGTTTVTFHIDNLDPATTLTGVNFTDTLPAGLVVGTPSNFVGSCNSGSGLT